MKVKRDTHTMLWKSVWDVDTKCKWPPAPTSPSPPLPRCILSWNSRNLSKQLLVVSRGVSFLVDLGPGAAVGGMRLEKHWVQLLFDSGWSSQGVFFPLVNLGLGAAVGGMRIEITTGYSCYVTCVSGSQWSKFPVGPSSQMAQFRISPPCPPAPHMSS